MKKLLTPEMAKKLLVVSLTLLLIVTVIFCLPFSFSKQVDEPYTIAMNLNAEMWKVESEIQVNKQQFETLRPQADKIYNDMSTLGKNNDELRAKKQNYQDRIDSLLSTGKDLEVKK